MEPSILKRQKIGDRFSNLPDYIAHHILSFLAMEDLFRLSLASKNCRELCISIPFLNFDATEYITNPSKRDQFMRFVDRFMMSLSETTVTRRFCIRWPFLISDAEFHILTWLRIAVRCKVEEIDLTFTPNKGSDFILPSYVLSCKTLKNLSLCLHGCILKIPLWDHEFIQLQYLSLRNVRIVDEGFGEWLSSSCKFLKQLHLKQINGMENFSINSISLQYLTILIMKPNDLCHISISGEKIQEVRVILSFNCSKRKSLKIHAPNLKVLKLEGYPMNHYCLGDLLHLEFVGLYFIFRSHSTRDWISTELNFIDVLRSVSRTPVLQIHSECVEALLHNGVRGSFNNLCSLHIYTSRLYDALVPAMASFLQGTPDLKFLFINSNEFVDRDANANKRRFKGYKAFAFSMGYWEDQNLSLIHQLEKVAIDLFRAEENELELVKYLLNHGKALKKMTIYFSPPLPSNLNEYTEASTAKLVFRRK